MIILAELVAKSSLMLLFIVYWAIHYIDLSEDDQLIQLLSSSMIVFFLINSCRINIFFVKQYESRCWNVVDTVYSDWLLVSFIEREFSIVFLIWNYIAFSRSSLDVFVASIWKRDDHNRCSRIVLSDTTWCRKFIVHESFDKLRKLFSSFWCFWFMIIAMSSRELEMTDVCR